MNATDATRFFSILTGIADYYGKKLAEGVQALYWEGLKAYDLPAVEKALWAHTQDPDSGQFMPKIADVTRHLQGRSQDQAAIAWSKVDSAVRRIGTYRDVAFDDAIIHRVIADMGGWIKLGTANEESWPFIANEFQNRYRGYRLRGEVPEYPPVLIGISNAHNGKEGFQLQPPMMIGEERRVRQVMLAGTTAQLIEMRQAKEVIAPQSIKQIEAA